MFTNERLQLGFTKIFGLLRLYISFFPILIYPYLLTLLLWAIDLMHIINIFLALMSAYFQESEPATASIHLSSQEFFQTDFVLILDITIFFQ